MHVESIQLPLPDEEWRPVPDFDGWYEVSNLGRVRRVRRGNHTRPGYVRGVHLDSYGYPIVSLYRHNKPHTRSVHRLVARVFLGEPSAPRLQVNHIDGIKTNNRVENLEWVTSSENRRHAFRIGLAHGYGVGSKGEANPGAKLTWDQVREIRALHYTVTQAELAKRFGVSVVAIARVHSGKFWQVKPS